jgi:hypothetical protein
LHETGALARGEDEGVSRSLIEQTAKALEASGRQQ